jgi:hypothetical protein
LPPENWAAVSERLLAAGPLRLGARYSLLHPGAARSGYVDLGPESRLEVVAPITRSGAPADLSAALTTNVAPSAGGLTVTLEAPPDLIGVERTWYTVAPTGIEPIGTSPRINPFQGTRARFWRLVYKADQSSVLVAADSRRELEETTAALLNGGNASPGSIAVPRSLGLNPYQAVMVNGSEVRVALGATLRAVVRQAGKKQEDVLPTLVLTKRFGGRMLPVEFDRTRSDVLDLVMEGDETVRW